MKERMRGIFFDLDGTLIDSVRDLATAVNETRASYGLAPLAERLVGKNLGHGVRHLVESSLGEISGGYDVEEAVRRQLDFYHRHQYDTTDLYDTVRESLERFRAAAIPMAVFTNKPEVAARQILERLDAADYFSYIMGGGSGFPLKPDPGGAFELLRRMNCGAAESWMVGDHCADLELGRRSGMRRCFARWGIGETRGEEFDFAAESMGDFAEHILER